RSRNRSSTIPFTNSFSSSSVKSESFIGTSLLGSRLPFGAVNDVLRSRRLHGIGLPEMARRNIHLEPLQEGTHLHVGRHGAHPHVHPGFQLIEVLLHAKLRIFHKIG